MNENYENKELSVNAQPNVQLLSKWLRILFYVQIARLVAILLGSVPVMNDFVTWLGRGVSLCAVVALYAIAQENPRYRTAAILQTVTLAGGYIAVFLGSFLITSAVLICGIIASYQEFHGHSEITASMDTKLSGKWSSLFYWELGIGLTAGLFTTIGVVIGVLAGYETEAITNIVLVVTSVVSGIPQAMYLMYMKKTLQFIS